MNTAMANPRSVLDMDTYFMQFQAGLDYYQQDLLAMPVQEITEEVFYHMLEVLPPLRWKGLNSGFETFLMSEFSTGNVTRMYAKRGVGNRARYFSKEVDVTRPETWITQELIDSLAN